MWNKRIILLLAATLLVSAEPLAVGVPGLSIPQAQAAAYVRRRPAYPAHVRHPARPASAAGVARRTTRRAWRRTAVYVAALPRGCVRVSLYGSTVWNCSGTYYQPYGGRYVVVRAY